MASNFFAVVCLLILINGVDKSQGFILIPEELQSVLQLAYSFLPTVNTGIQDSKVGVGFRLGKNADVQVLLEFGPQTMTESSRRRHVSNHIPRGFVRKNKIITGDITTTVPEIQTLKEEITTIVSQTNDSSK